MRTVSDTVTCLTCHTRNTDYSTYPSARNASKSSRVSLGRGVAVSLGTEIDDFSGAFAPVR